MPFLQTDQLAARYRTKALNSPERQVLVTNFLGTQQEQDLKEPANCAGFGRVRHFVRKRSDDWPLNPLPLDPAAKALGLAHGEELRTQVFQNAVCNWRCWYCFVPFGLLDANRAHSSMKTAGELIDLWLAESNRPRVIDLTGGQPELVPEWVLWMMSELKRRNLDRLVYLWSDDNLSSDYFWTALGAADREFIASYPMYGKVCCFKGFDESSFSFNTMASPEQYDRQFERMRRLLGLGALDLYAYVTFTTPETDDLHAKVSRFVDRLQALDENLPLRTVPLKIEVFTPTASRMNGQRSIALDNQLRVADAWRSILADRFASEQRELRICDVPLLQRVTHGS